jgi:hypothetical protein
MFCLYHTRWNFKLRSIFICFAYIILNGILNLDQFHIFASIRLDRFLNLDQYFYILPLLDFVTMNLHMIFIHFASIKFLNCELR